MAIFYEMIKGAAPSKDKSYACYNYIVWTNEEKTAPSVYSNVKSNNAAPINYNTLGEIQTNVTDLGSILCSKIPNTTEEPLNVQNVINFFKKIETGIPVKEGSLSAGDDGVLFTGDKVTFTTTDNSPTSSHIEGGTITADNYTFNKNKKINIDWSAVESVKLPGSATFNKNETNLHTVSVNSLTATNQIEASYFNSTSDIRAKKDIAKIDFSALNLISSVPIYSYKYKNDITNTSTIGIMAQDLLPYQEQLQLVSNEKATGENNDYMSIKDNKLIFILWKAIQEQQEEINKLKEQLARGN